MSARSWISLVATGLATLGCVLPVSSEIGPPLMGYRLNLKGELRPVWGVPGNVVLGPVLAVELEQAHFGGEEGFAVSRDQVMVFGRDGEAKWRWLRAGAVPMAGFDWKGRVSLLYWPEQGSLWQRTAHGWAELGWAPRPDDVVAGLAEPKPGQIVVLLARQGVLGLLWLVGGMVALEEPLPSMALPAVLMGDGTVLMTSGDELVARQLGGEVAVIARVDEPPIGLRLIGRDVVEAVFPSGRLAMAVHRTEQGWGVFWLPEVSE